MCDFCVLTNHNGPYTEEEGKAAFDSVVAKGQFIPDDEFAALGMDTYMAMQEEDNNPLIQFAGFHVIIGIAMFKRARGAYFGDVPVSDGWKGFPIDWYETGQETVISVYQLVDNSLGAVAKACYALGIYVSRTGQLPEIFPGATE